MTDKHNQSHESSSGESDADYNMAAEQDSGASENDYDVALPEDDGNAALKSSTKKSEHTRREKHAGNSSDDSAYDLADDNSELTFDFSMNPVGGAKVESDDDHVTGARVKVIKIANDKYVWLVFRLRASARSCSRAAQRQPRIPLYEYAGFQDMPVLIA